MKAAWTIAKREIFAFFLSPVAYVVLTAWLLWCGASYWLLAEFYAGQMVSGGVDSPLTAFFGNTVLFFIPLLVLSPLLTMRLVAEERQRGTLESVLTTPISEIAYIAGKYLAAMVFWVALWVPTLLYVWITSQYGSVDSGAILTSYFGVFMIGVYYMALGLLASVISPTPIVAAATAFFALGIFFVVGIGAFVLQGKAKEICDYLSVWGHMSTFSKGIVDSRFLVLDVSIAVVALTASVLLLRRQRRL